MICFWCYRNRRACRTNPRLRLYLGQLNKWFKNRVVCMTLYATLITCCSNTSEEKKKNRKKSCEIRHSRWLNNKYKDTCQGRTWKIIINVLEFFETMEKVRDPKENAIAQATFLLLTPPNQIFIILNFKKFYLMELSYENFLTCFGFISILILLNF